MQDVLAFPTPVSIPAWVEEDGIRIRSCDATCMIIVDRERESIGLSGASTSLSNVSS